MGADKSISLPGFRIQRELGRGGSAVVYLAEKASGELCALKVFHTAPDSESRRRILGEWKASMGKGRLVRVQDFVEAEGRAVLVMDYVSGPSLAELQARLPYVLPEISVALAAEILESLHELHSAGVIHRDLKPSNVLISQEGVPLLTDFGLAKWSDASTHTLHGVILGSPEFMSPEQAQGDIVTAASDLFSVASVLYFLVTGTKPFSRPTPLATLAAVIKGEFEPAQRRNPKISPTLARLLQKALKPQARDRFATAAEFASALREYLRESGFPEDLSFALWLRNPSEETMRALRAMAERLAARAEGHLRAGRREEAMGALSHLGLIAPDSLVLEELLAQVEKSRRRLAWWWWPALGAPVALGLAAAFFLWPRPNPVGAVASNPAPNASAANSAPNFAPGEPLSAALETPASPPAAAASGVASGPAPEQALLEAPRSPPPPPAPRLSLIRFQLPDGVEVEWNGVSIPLDRPFRARAGRHDVTFRKEGFPALRRQVEVKPGETTTIRVN